ncbi:polyprenyl synthetase [Dictyocaulus viviparus]|uniref:Polyprenyl synthetase n=1 Tax=Dictyocaulus viviparus TaxID=29172 RepID=A0A0D8Y1Y1_DICVI|nr:polyprenyl synthetase [Dictyocaulus viviparus]
MTVASTRSAYRLASKRTQSVSPSFRRNYCVAPSLAQLRKPTIPSFVTDKLKDMQIEIASQFASDIPYPTASYTPLNTIPTTSSEFTNNLEKMAKYYFEQGGKMFRPTIALLMANACNSAAPKGVRLECGSSEVSPNQYKIGMISEMIHTASLVHDDVIDDAPIRRGNASVNAIWGNKMAVLVGDFILARATQILCSINRPNVISVMASIIEDLVMGEFMQMTAKTVATNDKMEHYMQRTFKKTASLFANTCKSVALLAECNAELQWRASEYGRHLGIAFQLVDDLLDFISSADIVGKPVSADLKLVYFRIMHLKGIATGPVILAAQQYPELNILMARKFAERGDLDRARNIVLNSDGIARTRNLARQHSQDAARLAAMLPNGEGVADVLVDFALSQVDRQS